MRRKVKEIGGVLDFVVEGVFDSICSCNGDKFSNACCLIVKIPGFFILKNLGISNVLYRGF